jgi:hypothetical protein
MLMRYSKPIFYLLLLFPMLVLGRTDVTAYHIFINNETALVVHVGLDNYNQTPVKFSTVTVPHTADPSHPSLVADGLFDTQDKVSASFYIQLGDGAKTYHNTALAGYNGGLKSGLSVDISPSTLTVGTQMYNLTYLFYPFDNGFPYSVIAFISPAT